MGSPSLAMIKLGNKQMTNFWQLVDKLALPVFNYHISWPSAASLKYIKIVNRNFFWGGKSTFWNLLESRLYSHTGMLDLHWKIAITRNHTFILSNPHCCMQCRHLYSQTLIVAGNTGLDNVHLFIFLIQLKKHCSLDMLVL